MASPGARGTRPAAPRGFVLAVVSNQLGAARARLLLRRWTRSKPVSNTTSPAAVAVEAFRYCLHDVDAECAPGMLLELAHELDLDLVCSWMIGDSESDVMAGQAAGCRTAFLGTLQAAVAADVVAASLDETSRVISGASITTAR